MSKYIIEIAEEYEEYFKGVLICGIADGKFAVDVIAREDLEELNSDYINEHFGSLQDEAYQAGLNDAWEAARKIAQEWEEDSDTEHRVVIDDSIRITLDSMTAQEAIDKIKAYEDKHSDRIEVGDIVDVYGNLGVVTYMYELKACVMMIGDGSSSDWNLDELKKTGKHYDIQSILEAMKS